MRLVPSKGVFTIKRASEKVSRYNRTYVWYFLETLSMLLKLRGRYTGGISAEALRSLLPQQHAVARGNHRWDRGLSAGPLARRNANVRCGA